MCTFASRIITHSSLGPEHHRSPSHIHSLHTSLVPSTHQNPDYSPTLRRLRLRVFFLHFTTHLLSNAAPLLFSIPTPCSAPPKKAKTTERLQRPLRHASHSSRHAHAHKHDHDCDDNTTLGHTCTQLAPDTRLIPRTTSSGAPVTRQNPPTPTSPLPLSNPPCRLGKPRPNSPATSTALLRRRCR